MRLISLPDITPAQLLAIVGSVLGVLIAGGLDLSEALQGAILNLVTVLGPVLLVGDAVIRHGRSRALANPPRPPIEGDGELGA